MPVFSHAWLLALVLQTASTAPTVDVTADVQRIQDATRVNEYVRVVVQVRSSSKQSSGFLRTRLCGPWAFLTYMAVADQFVCVACPTACLAVSAVFPTWDVQTGKECVCDERMNIYDFWEYVEAADGRPLPSKYFQAGTVSVVGSGAEQRVATAVWSAQRGVPVEYSGTSDAGVTQKRLRKEGWLLPSVLQDTLWWWRRVESSFGVDRNLRDAVTKMPIVSDVLVLLWPLQLVRDLLEADEQISVSLPLKLDAEAVDAVQIPTNTLLAAVEEDARGGAAACTAAELQVVVDQIRSIQRLVTGERRGGWASDLQCQYGVSAYAVASEVGFQSFSAADRENLYPGRLKYLAAHDAFSFELAMKTFAAKNVLHCDDMYRWILRRAKNLVRRGLSYTALSGWQSCWKYGLAIVRKSATGEILADAGFAAAHCVADRDGRAEFAKRAFETSAFLLRLRMRQFSEAEISGGGRRAMRTLQLWEQCADEVWGVFDRQAGVRVGRRCVRDADCRWSGLRCMRGLRREDERRYGSVGFCGVPRGSAAVPVAMACVYERLGLRSLTSVKLEILGEVESNAVTPTGASELYAEAETTTRVVEQLYEKYSVSFCTGPKTAHPLSPAARLYGLDSCQAKRMCNWNMQIGDSEICDSANDEPSFCGVSLAITWALQQGRRSVCRETRDVAGLMKQKTCWEAYEVAMEAERRCIAKAKTKVEAEDCYTLGSLHSSALMTCMRGVCANTYPTSVNFDNEACGITGRDSASLCMDECRSVSAPSPLSIATCYREMRGWETDRDCHYSAAGDTKVIHHVDDFNERLVLARDAQDPDFLTRPKYCTLRVYLAGRATPRSASAAATEKTAARLRAFQDMRDIHDSREAALQANLTLVNDLSEDVIYEVKTAVVNGSTVRVAETSDAATFTGAWQGCSSIQSCTCDCETCEASGARPVGYLCSSEAAVQRRAVLENAPECSECQHCCSDFCAHQSRCETDVAALFFPQVDNSSFLGTTRPQPVAGTVTGVELRVVDTLSECNRAFGGRPGVHYDALAPWTPSSPTLNRFEADKCLSYTGVCMRKLGLTPSGLSVSNKGWQWTGCFDDTFTFTDPSASSGGGGRRLTAITNDPGQAYPLAFQDTLAAQDQYVEWDPTLGGGQGACLYRQLDPFDLFGGTATSAGTDVNLDMMGWPSAFTAAGQTVMEELQLPSLPVGDSAQALAWETTYNASQVCSSPNRDKEFTKYNAQRFWWQGQNNDQENCESQMCDLDAKIYAFDDCALLQGCSADCWTCVSSRPRNREQGVCVLQGSSETTCEATLNGVWLTQPGQLLNPDTGELQPLAGSAGLCALVNKSVQFCVGQDERVVRCADFGGAGEACEGDAVAQLLGCQAKQQKCRSMEDCALAGSCESDTVDGIFSTSEETACIAKTVDDALLLYELCDEQLSVCFLPLASGFGMHVVDMGERAVDFLTEDFLYAGILGRARSGHPLSRTRSAGDAPTAARLEKMTQTRCDAVTAKFPHLATSFLTRPRSRLQCEGLQGCCVRFEWSRCVEWKGGAASAADCEEGVWQAVWQWTRRGEWKNGTMIGNANRQWKPRRFTNINNYGVELDRVKTKNLLFTSLANSVVNEHAAAVLRERVEPLISALEVVARLCGAQSSTKQTRAALKTSMLDSSLYSLSFSSGVYPLRAGVGNQHLSAFGNIRVSHSLFLIQDTTPSPTAALLNDTLITSLPVLYLTVHPAETLLFGNAANQYALPSRFKYLTAKRLAYLATLPQPEPEPGVNLSVPTWSVVGGASAYPTAVLEWMVRVANPSLYTTTPPPVLSEDEQKRQQELTAQILEADAQLYWTYKATYSAAPSDAIQLEDQTDEQAASCSNAAVNSQGVVVGQVAGDCVSLALSDAAVNTRNPVEVCWPLDFAHPLQVQNATLPKLDVAKLVQAARVDLTVESKSGITIPDDNYGLTRVGNSWVEPLGRRVEIRGERFCSFYLVNEDQVICPIRRTSNEDTFPEIFSDDTTELASSCNFIEPFLDAVQAEHAAKSEARSYTPLASQQQASFDRYHDGADAAVPEVKYEFEFVEGPVYEPKQSFAFGTQSILAALTIVVLILIN